jgi:flagellin-specific chaperone FliS
MATELNELPYNKLKKRIKKTRELLDDLEAEMKNRKLERQHDGVDDLDEHLNIADSSILSLTGIIKSVMSKD